MLDSKFSSPVAETYLDARLCLCLSLQSSGYLKTAWHAHVHTQSLITVPRLQCSWASCENLCRDTPF